MTRHELPSQFAIKPPQARDALLASVTRTWEDDVCDLSDLADLTATLVGDTVSTFDSGTNVHLAPGEVRRILFCVYEMNRRAERFKERFYAAVDAEAPASSKSSARDDALLALRPMFEACRANMKAACDAVNVAEDPEGAGAGIGSSVEVAEAAQGAAVHVDLALADLVAFIPARTEEGLRFKREIRDHWRDCERRDLDASITADAAAIGVPSELIHDEA